MFESCSDQRWQIEIQFLILRFFELSDLVNNHLLCYWPTIHNLISKICPKFQVLSSQVFKVYELHDEHWAKIVQNEKFWTPNAIRCIDHRFAFKNSGIAFLALIFNLSYLRSTILHPKKQCETVQVIWRFIYRFFRAIVMNQWLSG